MKEIVKLLKSMQFWLAAITLVVTAIAAYPVIEKWRTVDPVVYLGKSNKLEKEKTTIVNYLIPTEAQNTKARFTFPIIFANENSTMLEKFFISLEAQTIKTTTGGWMPRLLSYSDFYAISGKENELFGHKIEIDHSGIQKQGNPNDGVNFAPNDLRENIFAVNMVDNGKAGIWDEFNFTLTVGALNCATQNYKFIVRCYLSDNIERKKDELIKMKKPSHEQSFLITPILNKLEMTSDSIMTSVFEIGDETNIVEL